MTEPDHDPAQRLAEAIGARTYAGMGYRGDFAALPDFTRERYLAIGRDRLAALADPHLRDDLRAWVASLDHTDGMGDA